MDFYENIRDNIVNPLLEQFGKPVEIQKRSTSTYDPVNGTYSPNSYTKADDGTAVQTNYMASEIDGKTIINGDKKLLLLTENNIEIKVDDRIVMESENWNVENINEVKPANVRVLYKLQIRKG